jgi:tetratricopeptide (TPR) repeat protein
MKKLLALLFLVLTAASSLPAEPLTVEYLDGVLEVQRGGRWAPVDFGDLLQESDLVRLAPGALAELSSGSVRLTLSSAGTYRVADLLASSRRVASWGVAALMSDKLKTIAQSGQKGEVTTMGVRGAEAGAVTLEWMEGGQETVEQGQVLMAAGKYEQAARLFEEGLDSALDQQEEQTLLFYAGYSWALAGRDTQAWRHLLRVQDDPRSAWFSELVLLKGRLLIESLSFRQALDLFDRYLQSYPGGAQIQEVTFLSGLCWAGLGDSGQAQALLRRTWEIDPSSAVGREAQKQLQSL